MKITILNGSPRKQNTAAMVEAFAEGAKAAGHEVETIQVGKLKINGCLACEYCHGKGEGKCVQKDDMEKVMPAYMDCDMIVFASPIYYFDMTAQLSAAIQSACLAHDVDARRSYFAALAMEEMAGNIVRHGLTRDRRRHEIDLRVTWKGDSLVLCIKDDCVRFDPVERLNMLSPKDPATNIGLRLAHRIALDMSYQSLLGLNVLLIRI